MLKYLKIVSILSFAFIITACDSTSESPSTQVFAVLSAQNALVFRDSNITAETLDSITTPMGKGGMTVSTYVPKSSGGTVAYDMADVTFTYDQLGQSRHDAYVFKKDFTGTSTSGATTVGFNGTNALVVGGKRLGLRYGDFGYWAETVDLNVVGDTTKGNYTKTEKFWAPFFVFDPANKATNIPTTNTGDYAFNGRVLGGVDLYDSNGAIYKNAELTGDITLNANFKPGEKDLTATVDTAIGGNSWYTFKLVNTAGVDNTAGGFSGGTAVITGTNGAHSDYELKQSGFTTDFGGQFLGADAAIPTEVLGQFSIVYSGPNTNGYRPEIYGAFGAKR